MNDALVLCLLSMRDEEAESLLDALGLLCGGELIDLFHDVSGAHCANLWSEDKEFETHGMKMTQVVKEVHYSMSGEGWICNVTGFEDYSEFEITGHAMMLIHFLNNSIVNPETVLAKIHYLRNT